MAPWKRLYLAMMYCRDCYAEKVFLYLMCMGDNRTMVKKQTGRRPKGNLVKEIDAAIVLLTRVR
jgi:hypothetical protein